jgi:3-oxoacyl-[acyl-carrier-protein] synthase II
MMKMKRPRPENRIVVTGLGAVTPFGPTCDTLWQGLLSGQRALSELTKFDPTGLRNTKAGQIHDWQFAAADFSLERTPDEAVQFLLVAAAEAISDAGLSEQLQSGAPVHPQAGTVLATNFGGGASWEEYMSGLLDRQPSPDRFADFSFHTAISDLCHAFALGGPCSQLSMACASGTAAIGLAAEMIRDGQVEMMLVGGYDALAPSPLSGLSLLRTITDDDLRPFSANRSGTLFGEGAGVLLLESLEHARKRGARCYCEVLGAWQNNNAYHLTAPDAGGAGMARVLAGALHKASVATEQIQHINAHGTGTEYHDVAETEAIKSVLGAAAYDATVVSIKGALSHLMGAAGAVEGLVAALSIYHQKVPPTTNYSEPDPACDLDYVTEGCRDQNIQYAASISAGIGGDNSCVILGRLD